MENGGAKHRIDQTRPGSGGVSDQERKTRLLKSAVTRTRNTTQRIESDYGARDIPSTSPHYPKVRKARDAEAAARQAWAEHTRNI